MYSRDLFLERAQLALLDGAIVFGSLLVATVLRHGATMLLPGPDGDVRLLAYLFPATIAAAACVILFRYEGLYSGRFGRLVEAVRIARGAVVGTMATLALTFFYRGFSYSRATVLIFCPLSVGLLVLGRSGYRRYREMVRTNPSARRRVLIVGFGRVGQHIGRELLDRPSYYDLRCFLDDDIGKAGLNLDGRRVVGTTADLGRVVRDDGIDDAIIAIPSAQRGRIMEIIGECLRLKVRWKVVPDYYDLRMERANFDQVGGVPLLGMRGSAIVGFNWALKRSFDLTIASGALLLLSPLFALIALAVKATSRGPVFFRQRRVGLNGRSFTFLKFRSMHIDSDPALHRAYTTDWIYGRTGGGPTGPAPKSLGAAARDASSSQVGVHKIMRDPRITVVGRVLRRTSLDELPQLWNVIRGDMSLVGPRPAIPYEVERYTEWHRRRLEVLPGITGLWQVSGRNALSFEEMVRLDIQYIETWSLEQDLRILIKTAPVVLFGAAY